MSLNIILTIITSFIVSLISLIIHKGDGLEPFLLQGLTNKFIILALNSL